MVVRYVRVVRKDDACAGAAISPRRRTLFRLPPVARVTGFFRGAGCQ